MPPLLKNNASKHVVIAGLLHDVVEDEDVPLSDIRDEFGDDVATLVDGASEPEELTNADGGKVRPGLSARHIPLTLSKMQAGT